MLLLNHGLGNNGLSHGLRSHGVEAWEQLRDGGGHGLEQRLGGGSGAQALEEVRRDRVHALRLQRLAQHGELLSERRELGVEMQVLHRHHGAENQQHFHHGQVRAHAVILARSQSQTQQTAHVMNSSSRA